MSANISENNNQNCAASTLLDFGGTILNIEVSIRPTGYNRVGEVKEPQTSY